MRMWSGYGSEHSMNLVMIGSFKETGKATQAKDLIDKLTKLASDEPVRSYRDDPSEVRFSDEVLNFLMAANFHILGPADIEQFSYDVNVVQRGDKIVLKTDEADVSAFMKLLIDRGAKVEIFSAHDYPEADPC